MENTLDRLDSIADEYLAQSTASMTDSSAHTDNMVGEDDHIDMGSHWDKYSDCTK